MNNPFYAANLEGLLTEEQILSMSGLEFMKGILTGNHPAPPICQTMNFDLHEVEDGKAVFQGSPSFEHCNPIGTVHGGWYGTLLDSCLACAVMTRVPQGSVYTTLEYKINILRPIPTGLVVQGIGKIDHAGRSTGVAHGEIIGLEDGKLYATGSTTCIIMGKEQH